MNQFRAVLIFLWLLVSFAIGLLACVLRWGHPVWNRLVVKMFSWGALKIGGIRLTIEHPEKVYTVQPCIYVGNHQSGLDLAIFGSIYPKGSVMIGKRELLYIPFLGWFLMGAGNVLLDRSNRKKSVNTMEAAVDVIKRKGRSICIFPEGTRNKTLEGLLPFKKGAFYLAIDAQVPIVPIVSTSFKNIGTLESANIRGGDVTIRVLDPIYTNGLTRDSVNQLLEKTREKILEAYQELNAKK